MGLMTRSTRPRARIKTTRNRIRPASGQPKYGVLLSGADICALGDGSKVVELRFALSREDLAPHVHMNAVRGSEEWALPAELLKRTFDGYTLL